MKTTRGTTRRQATRTSSQRAVVERAEAYQRARLSAPIPISQLCHFVGLSERGLRNAFYGVRGMSPKRCMLAERLDAARRALTDGCDEPVTVTGIATRFGFYELGRFAATYKATFGETPSSTLRSTHGKLAPPQGSAGQGEADACRH